MSPHPYTEDQLVEQPAIGLFAEHSAMPNPHPGPLPKVEGASVDEMGLLGRETKGESVMTGRSARSDRTEPERQNGEVGYPRPV